MQLWVWLPHTLRSAAAASWCTASVMPGASSPTSAATPPHSRTLTRFCQSSQHSLDSAAAACSCTAAELPGASRWTSAATPPHSRTLSLPWVVFLHTFGNATAARSCAAAVAPHAVAIRTCKAGTPATTLATAAEPPDTGSQTSFTHVKESVRREQAYQGGRVDLWCRLLAAGASVPEPRPHAAPRAAVLDLERAGAALSVSSADAPALERDAGPRLLGGLVPVALLRGDMQPGRSTSSDRDKRRRIAHRRALPTEAVCGNQWRCCRTCAPASGRPRFIGRCCVHPLAYQPTDPVVQSSSEGLDEQMAMTLQMRRCLTLNAPRAKVGRRGWAYQSTGQLHTRGPGQATLGARA